MCQIVFIFFIYINSCKKYLLFFSALSLGITLLFLSSAHGFYGPGDDVVELTPSNFHKTVIDSKELWLVEFYAPWYVASFPHFSVSS